MALVAEIAAFIATAGLGTVGTTIFRYELPATPTVCIAVLKPPVDDGPIFTFGQTVPASDQPRFDVVVRDSDKAAAFLLARKIRNALSEQSGLLTNPDFGSGDGSSASTRYHNIRAISEPAERDSQAPLTYEVAVRFAAMKERS